MAFSLKGIKLPHRKNTAGTAVERMDIDNTITIPTVMHIGKPAIPVVKAGDHVHLGALIAKADEGLSSPVYASVSGNVVGVSDIFNSAGNKVPAILIDSDGEYAIDESVVPPVIDSKDALINAMRDSGVVGLGGAGFPTYAKFATDKKIDVLIINGAECEPYITSDTYTMLEKADDIAFAIETITKFIDVEKVIVAVEKNKPEAIKKMEEMATGMSKVSVKVLKPKYPTGGEKVLVYSVTGRAIGDGKLPADVGCLVCNCTTMAALGNYFKTGMPLVEKCITVDGSAVNNPKNVIVPIGIHVGDVFKFCGGFSTEPGKILYGGPMMGISIPSLDEPVLKQTNALLALSEKDAKAPKETPCIQCGACTNNCPMGLSVTEIARAYKKGEYDRLEKLGVGMCMECGCCAYNCPAKRPLVHVNKLAKAALREWKEKEAKA
ncbi:MAG: electron transport complex subunit RsxC [Clostridia bacterium]|nr:electron transport complex subunit RsxC [Clostridia bacterium]